MKSVCSPVNTLHDPDPMPVMSKSRQVTLVMRAHHPQSSIPVQEPKEAPIHSPKGEDILSLLVFTHL